MGTKVITLALLLFTAVAVADPSKSTVKVASFKGVRMTCTGTGFSIGDTLILTAKHVTDGGRSHRIKTPSGHWLNATVIAHGGRQSDWAILQTQPHGLPVLAPSRMVTGSVTAYGWPDGAILTSRGTIQSWAFQGRNGYATTKVRQGWSGGAVIASDGGYVGIVSMQTPTGDCLFVKASDVR